MSQQTFTLDQICILTAVPKRTVRYYIQIGLLHRPEGENRGARYLSSHVETLLRVKKLSEAGISLDRIRDVLAGEPASVPPRPQTYGTVEVKSHIRIAPGIEIQVSPEEARATSEQLRALAKDTLAAWNRISKERHEK